jgi:hypothetical protein
LESLISGTMKKLSKLRFKSNEFSSDVMIKGLSDVLPAGWNTYDGFKIFVNSIINGGERMPFTLKTKDKFTNQRDFWVTKSFIDLSKGDTYDDVSKKSVLLSQQFSDFVKDYCKNVLKDEVLVWIFSGTSTGKQFLDVSKIDSRDLEMLRAENQNVNADDLIMIQFKKKVKELMVGSTSNGSTSNGSYEKKVPNFGPKQGSKFYKNNNIKKIQKQAENIVASGQDY